uniref:Galectin n=1 Tax=Toxocara canis TaxID=6265 RepID=A0A183UV38_TOXCA
LQVAVDGRHLCDYLYRIGISDVQTIFITGNVHIDLIEFQGEVSLFLVGVFRIATLNIKRRSRCSLCWIMVRLVGLKIRNTPSEDIIYEVIVDRMPSTRIPLRPRKADTESPICHGPIRKPGSVVRNSTYAGVWQREERQMSQFPFTRGVTFDMVFKADFFAIMIEINGEHFTKFVYRGDVLLNNVNKIELKGDVAVQMVVLK